MVFVRELYAVRIAFDEALEKLVEKINSPSLEVNQVSPMEALVLNMVLFGRFSVSKHFIAAELKKNGRIRYRIEGKLHLIHLVQDEVVSDIDSVKVGSAVDVESVETPVPATVGTQEETSNAGNCLDLKDIYPPDPSDHDPATMLRRRISQGNMDGSENGTTIPVTMDN